MNNSEHDELIALNQRLLKSIAEADWLTYAELCDPSLTAFEPEAAGQLVEGLDFHAYYFKLSRLTSPRHTTMASPHVRILNDVAIVAYTRLTQKLDADGRPHTESVNETRIWHKQNGAWKHVHFHRSKA
jgi:ketosteroid isomerase-like protein